MKRMTFYHAGCPVCIAAEEQLADSIDKNRFEIDVVHLGNDQAKIAEAERLGVKSVPALVHDGTVFHINFGALISDLKE